MHAAPAAFLNAATKPSPNLSEDQGIDTEDPFLGTEEPDTKQDDKPDKPLDISIGSHDVEGNMSIELRLPYYQSALNNRKAFRKFPNIEEIKIRYFPRSHEIADEDQVTEAFIRNHREPILNQYLRNGAPGLFLPKAFTEEQRASMQRRGISQSFAKKISREMLESYTYKEAKNILIQLAQRAIVVSEPFLVNANFYDALEGINILLEQTADTEANNKINDNRYLVDYILQAAINFPITNQELSRKEAKTETIVDKLVRNLSKPENYTAYNATVDAETAKAILDNVVTDASLARDLITEIKSDIDEYSWASFLGERVDAKNTLVTLVSLLKVFGEELKDQKEALAEIHKMFDMQHTTFATITAQIKEYLDS